MFNLVYNNRKQQPDKEIRPKLEYEIIKKMASKLFQKKNKNSTIQINEEGFFFCSLETY